MKTKKKNNCNYVKIVSMFMNYSDPAPNASYINCTISISGCIHVVKYYRR